MLKDLEENKYKNNWMMKLMSLYSLVIKIMEKKLNRTGTTYKDS